jgi:hypothetical protein
MARERSSLYLAVTPFLLLRCFLIFPMNAFESLIKAIGAHRSTGFQFQSGRATPMIWDSLTGPKYRLSNE